VRPAITECKAGSGILRRNSVWAGLRIYMDHSMLVGGGGGGRGGEESYKCKKTADMTYGHTVRQRVGGSSRQARARCGK
jgi:hypothetical protein